MRMQELFTFLLINIHKFGKIVSANMFEDVASLTIKDGDISYKINIAVEEKKNDA